MKSWLPGLVLSSTFLFAAVAAPRQPALEDAPAFAPTFQEGEIITFEEIEKLRPFLPPEFWDNRDFFFYDGMRLNIGPFHYDYSPPPEHIAATERFRGEARIGPDGSLENYTAGDPFPIDEIDCLGDSDAGVKVMWDFDYQWDGDGARATFFYSYWDRGEELPLYYEGTAKTIRLSNRIEARYLDKNQGDIFRGEKRKSAFGIEVQAPFDARGIALLTYRYKSSNKPPSEAKDDDTWVYVPTLRRVRRISAAQRTDAVAGTDFTFDDLGSFAGIVPQYEWTCLGERDVIGPMNSRVKAFPYDKEHNFGPYGLSYADDSWELRTAFVIRMEPKNADHPYHHKIIYIDKQTLMPLYSFAYDRKDELWKVIWHNHRWSEDTSLTGAWYTGWEGIKVARDLRLVSDTIANIQTGTGNRIEFWDSHGMPLKNRGKIRRYIDVGRLTKGR